jgi:peptidoglycan/LPS O-acetylase OafA/YrhL
MVQGSTQPFTPQASLMPRAERARQGLPERAGFRADVEGMRAVAIVVVVLYHAGFPLIRGGYVGVDVFFVLSGFVITMTLSRELARRGTISIAGFYARRAARLLPAATAVIVVTLVASWLWLSPLVIGDIAMDAVASTLYVINYRLAIVGVDYFAGDAPSPLQHYWSLAVEEQFYFVWPLLLLATTVWLARRARHSSVRPTGQSAIALLVVIIVSFAACVWIAERALPWAYFGAPTRAWELAVGALVAVGATALARVPARAAAVATWTGLAFVVVSAVWYDDATVFPGVATLLPVAGTALVLAGGCPSPHDGTEIVLRGSVFQVVGRLSYSWYLWHWPVLIIAPVALGFAPGLGVRLSLAAGSLGLAWLCYTLLESPVRRAAIWRARPWRGIAVGASLSGSAAVMALIFAVAVPSPVGTGHADDLAAKIGHDAWAQATASAGAPEPTSGASRVEADLTAAIRDGVSRTYVPANLTPTLRDARRDLPQLYRDGCDPGFLGITVAGPCVYGDPNSPTVAVLYGDSHAGHWFPAVNLIAQRHHWRLHVIIKSACSPAMVVIQLKQIKRAYTECDPWRAASMARIRQLHPAVVVMSSRIDLAPAVPGDPDRVWADGWVEAVKAVTAAGTRVVLIEDTPDPRQNVLECVSTHVSDVRPCGVAVRDAIPTPERRTMVAEALAEVQVRVVDPFSWFCALGKCPSIIGNVLVYRDTSHVTTVYSALLAPLLEREIT